MKLNRDGAFNLWKRQYGNAETAIDFAGRRINLEDYGDTQSEYGWNLDHICPLSMEGKTKSYNLTCCNIRTNREKGCSYPFFNANGKRFAVVGYDDETQIVRIDESDVIANETGFNLYNIKEAKQYWGKCSDRKNACRLKMINMHVIMPRFMTVDMKRVYNFYSEIFSPLKVIITDRVEGEYYAAFGISAFDLDGNTSDSTCQEICELADLYAMYLRAEYKASVYIGIKEETFESEADMYHNFFRTMADYEDTLMLYCNESIRTA